MRDVEIYKVDDEYWDGGKGRDEEFMPPPDVEKVVADAEDRYCLKREKGGNVG